MNKKLFFAIPLISLVLTGCPKNGGHVHTFSDEWSKNANYHFHAATCEHEEITKDVAEHTFDENGVCTVCDYHKETHEHKFSNEYSHDNYAHWHAATCGCDDIIKDYAPHTLVNGECECGYKDLTPSTLAISEQPKDVEVNYPNSVSFEVKVNNEDLVKSYKWQTIKGYDVVDDQPVIVWTDLTGISTNDKVLTLPRVTEGPSTTSFRCKITDKKGNVVYSNEAKYIVKNNDTFVPVAFLGEYPIIANSTLDLADTPYGSGTISVDSTGSVYTFRNVNFCNEVYEIESGFIGLCFEIQTLTCNIEEYFFNFEGENIINNVYWEDDMNQGGPGMLILAANENIEPIVNFQGTGSLTINGGTMGILADCYLSIGIDMNLNGAANRLTKGIICHGIEICRGVTIRGNVGGHLIFTESSDSDKYSPDVYISSYAHIYANIVAAYVVNGATILNAISAVNSLYVDPNAYVDINIIVKTENAFAGEYLHVVNPVNGLYSYYGNVYINDATVNVNIIGLTSATTYDYEECTAYQILGIGGKTVNIKGSNINVKIEGYNELSMANGIYGGAITISDNSRVKVDVNVFNGGNGIIGTYNDSTTGLVKIDNSWVDIKVNNQNGPDVVSNREIYAGIRGRKITFELDSEHEVNVSVDEYSYATVETIEESETIVGYDPAYIYKSTSYQNVNVIAEEVHLLEINAGSYKWSHYVEGIGYVTVYIVFETLFDGSTREPVRQVRIVG